MWKINNESGTSIDRIWLKIRGKDGAVIPAISMTEAAIDNAVELEDGNIYAPH